MLQYDTQHIQNKHPGVRSKAVTQRNGWKINLQSILSIAGKQKSGLNTRHSPQRKGQTNLRHRSSHPSSTDGLHMTINDLCVQSRRCYTHIPSVDTSERLSLIIFILKISVYQILKLNESQEVGTWLASKSKHICQHIGICPRLLALFPKTQMGT